jgi:hypothetical protein
VVAAAAVVVVALVLVIFLFLSASLTSLGPIIVFRGPISPGISNKLRSIIKLGRYSLYRNMHSFHICLFLAPQHSKLTFECMYFVR